MVEAAGAELASPQNVNRVMARDFRRTSLETRCPLECTGILPSLGDMLETESPPLPSRHVSPFEYSTYRES